MQDVAALAGVSLKSVSRVVNREPGVSEAWLSGSTAAVHELGYRHNLAASNLRRGQRTASIGMLVQDLSNGFCSATLRAVEDRARERGVVVMAASIDEDGERERELVEGLVSRRIDGLILMPTGPRPALAGRPRSTRACAVVSRGPPTRHARARRGSGRQPGRRRTGGRPPDGAWTSPHRASWATTTTISTAVDRQDGYRSALRAAGREPDPGWSASGCAPVRRRASPTTQLLSLEDPPTAIFAARNVICEGAVLALQQRGLSTRSR